jgi:hypothetical protein
VIGTAVPVEVQEDELALPIGDDGDTGNPTVYEVGNHVSVCYEGQVYPGIIMAVVSGNPSDYISVSCLTKTHHGWEYNDNDIMDYPISPIGDCDSYVVGHIKTPELNSGSSNSRIHTYNIPEMDKYWRV